MRKLLPALVIGLLCLSACGGGQPGGTQSLLHRGTGEEPESLDVHKSRSTEAGHVQRDIGEGLVGYTREGELRPAAADHWTVSDDGTELIFVLRPDARWSNGDPVTAHDFAWSYRRLVNPETYVTLRLPDGEDFIIYSDIDRWERIPSLWPLVRGAGRITSGFGYRRDPLHRRVRHHDGVDIAASRGTRVRAPAKPVIHVHQ